MAPLRAAYVLPIKSASPRMTAPWWTCALNNPHPARFRLLLSSLLPVRTLSQVTGIVFLQGFREQRSGILGPCTNYAYHDYF
jgi:hypothetical protein